MEFRNKHAFISNNEHFSLIYDAFSTNPHKCTVLFASFYLFSLFFSFFILFSSFFYISSSSSSSLFSPNANCHTLYFRWFVFFVLRRNCQWDSPALSDYGCSGAKCVRLFSIISVAPERWGSLIESDRFDTLNWRKNSLRHAFFIVLRA